MKFLPQHDQMDCGPSCLAMVASHYGKHFSLRLLRERSFITREGVSLLGICQAAESIGFETLAARLSIDDFRQDMNPCILYWNQNHFVVLQKIQRHIFSRKRTYKLADPAHGFIVMNEDKFRQSWETDDDKGIALFLSPTAQLYKQPDEQEKPAGLLQMLTYLHPYKRQMFLLFIFLLIGTLTSLVFPILTQRLIDEGVNKKQLGVVGSILSAQLFFFLGNILSGICRNWIALTVGTRINIRIIADFLKNMLGLPVRFFDTKLTGDFSQRIQDHERIEQFLTSESLLTLFSMLTFSVFFGILWTYDYRLLLLYLLFTGVSITWSLFWISKSKTLDYFKFRLKAENQESIYEMLHGITEMKLHQFDDFKRKEWESIQNNLFKVNIRMLRFEQIQFSGYEFLNQLKNIIVTFLAASFVIKEQMTLGVLLSVSYIIGQMNAPISQLIVFFRSLQQARLSLARLYETQLHQKEEYPGLRLLNNEGYIKTPEQQRGIHLQHVSFQYEGPDSPYVLKDIDLFIPEGKVTAIVGASGSGKTTLIKLLLKFYEPCQGRILFNCSDLKEVSPADLRRHCGVVMQDGIIFSNTIERNIATSEEDIDPQKLERALTIANLHSFIAEKPLGLQTKAGMSGSGLSGGEKQRILIARTVYKNPGYLFMDEATSALDAENELVIHQHLQSFFTGKTVIIIAHRLSTVKNADSIVVLKKGCITEQGTHQQLVNKKGHYFELVRNQLELGE